MAKRCTDAIFLQLYGDDYEQFNTVADSIIPFWLMQLLRIFYIFALVLFTVLYVYIYFRASLLQLNFWALITTDVAFVLLLITSGQQMVYQKKLEQETCF